MAGKAYIGTSGWIYKHWRDGWYKGIRPKDYLAYDASKFTALEANGTFYRLPKRETFEAWAAGTPDKFRFAIKAHRFLTHRKKLKDVGEGILRQKDAASGLGSKLAAVVWQLPANFGCNLERLEQFLVDLKQWQETRHAIEFRHRSWFVPEVASLLADNNVAVCMSDAPKWPMWDQVTSDMVYVRLHGHERLYASKYTPEQLKSWAIRIQRWLNEEKNVHVYFDNDSHGHAPYDALALLDMVKKRK